MKRFRGMRLGEYIAEMLEEATKHDTKKLRKHLMQLDAEHTDSLYLTKDPVHGKPLFFVLGNMGENNQRVFAWAPLDFDHQKGEWKLTWYLITHDDELKTQTEQYIYTQDAVKAFADLELVFPGNQGSNIDVESLDKYRII